MWNNLFTLEKIWIQNKDWRISFSMIYLLKRIYQIEFSYEMTVYKRFRFDVWKITNFIFLNFSWKLNTSGKNVDIINQLIQKDEITFILSNDCRNSQTRVFFIYLVPCLHILVFGKICPIDMYTRLILQNQMDHSSHVFMHFYIHNADITSMENRREVLFIAATRENNKGRKFYGKTHGINGSENCRIYWRLIWMLVCWGKSHSLSLLAVYE